MLKLSKSSASHLVWAKWRVTEASKPRQETDLITSTYTRKGMISSEASNKRPGAAVKTYGVHIKKYL